MKIASGGSVPPVFHNKIVTFGFEDSYGNSGCLDITDFDSKKSFLMAIKEKLLQYQYCFAWGSKAIVRKKKELARWKELTETLLYWTLTLKLMEFPL